MVETITATPPQIADSQKQPELTVGRAIIKHPNKNKYLIIKRRNQAKHNPNKWEFPGGVHKAEEETIEETIIREVTEETGLTTIIENPQIYKAEKTVNNADSKYLGYLYVVFFYWAIITKQNEQLEPQITLDHESQAYKWASKAEIEAMGDNFTDDCQKVLPYI